MATTKTIYRTIKDFIQAAQVSSRARFKNENYEFILSIESRRTVMEEYKLEYKEWNREKYVGFSFCQSPRIADVIKDLRYECETLKIA